jgi:hypothetical protein
MSAPSIYKGPLTGAFILTLLYAFHFGIPMYATSSYLGTIFTSPLVSLLYILASALTLTVSLHVTKYIRRFHTYQFTQTVVIAEFVITVAFALTKNPYLLRIRISWL